MKICQTKIKVVVYLFILFLTCSCQEKTYYHAYQPVDPIGWDKCDTLFYLLPTPISSQAYEYEIGIRHKDSYPFRDIWLTINQDTLHLYLADSIGFWTGNGIGNMRLFTRSINPANLQKDSIQEIRITHIMQENPLAGIYDIGIQIKRKP